MRATVLLPEGRITTLTQQWRYVNLTRNSCSCAHLKGATCSPFRGGGVFNELSFDYTIALIQPGTTFSQTVTDKVLFATFPKMRIIQF